MGFNSGLTSTQNVNITGGNVNPCKFTATQTFVQATWNGVNDNATVYTVSAGKTLYITAINATCGASGNLQVLIDGATKFNAIPNQNVTMGNGSATIAVALATKTITVTGGGALGNRGCLVGYEE